MVSPLLFPSRTVALGEHLSHVLYPAPTVVEFHTVGVWHLSYRDLCPYLFPSLAPGLGLFRGLVEVVKHVGVCGMHDLGRLVSYSIPEKGDACS